MSDLKFNGNLGNNYSFKIKLNIYKILLVIYYILKRIKYLFISI